MINRLGSFALERRMDLIKQISTQSQNNFRDKEITDLEEFLNELLEKVKQEKVNREI